MSTRKYLRSGNTNSGNTPGASSHFGLTASITKYTNSTTERKTSFSNQIFILIKKKSFLTNNVKTEVDLIRKISK